jgi:anti-anti-sigma factor
MTTTGLFECEQVGDTLIVTPVADLSELDYQQIEADGKQLLAFLSDPGVKKVVLDFSRTDYNGSTALGWFLRFWKRVNSRNACLAFCNVSEHEKEILRVAKLDNLWPLCATREEALQAVGG